MKRRRTYVNQPGNSCIHWITKHPIVISNLIVFVISFCLSSIFHHHLILLRNEQRTTHLFSANTRNQTATIAESNCSCHCPPPTNKQYIRKGDGLSSKIISLPNKNEPSIYNKKIFPQLHYALVIAIMSSPSNIEKRNSIRKTWWNIITENNNNQKEQIYCKFFVGNVQNNTETRVNLTKEELEYNDIIRLDVEEHYNLLREKTMGVFQWINQRLNIDQEGKLKE